MGLVARPHPLDLNGDGFETVGLNANIHFDHDGDGVLTRTGWSRPADFDPLIDTLP